MKFINPFAERKRDASSLSFPSLSPNEAEARLLGANQDRTREIPMSTEATRKKDQLPAIVDEFLDLNCKTLRDLNDMQRRLKAFQDGSFPETKDSRLIKDVLLSLEKVIADHASMLGKLEQLRSAKSKRIQVLFRRRKVIHAIFLNVFVGMVLCVSIAAAMHAPPLLAALPTAATTFVSFGPLASWIRKGNFWKKEEGKIKTDVQTVNIMKVSSSNLMHELQKIKIMLKDFIDQQTISASDKACMNYMELGQLMEKFDEQLSVCCDSEIIKMARIEMVKKQMAG